jgi:hypothetical protein
MIEIKNYINGRYVSVFTNSDSPNRFICGEIVAANEDEFVLKSITQYGQYDGFILNKVHTIFNISHNGKYEKKISKLAQTQYKNNLRFQTDDEDLLNALFNFAKANKLIVSIEINFSDNKDIIGFVNDINENTVIIYTVDEYGEDDGVSEVIVNEITSLCVDTIDEQIISLLHSYNKEM